MKQEDPPEVKAAILASMENKLKSKFGPSEPTDFDKLRQRGIEVNKKVAALWLPIDKAYRDLGNTHRPAEVAETVMKFYLDEFCHWSHEDLLVLLCMMHTENAVAQVC